MPGLPPSNREIEQYRQLTLLLHAKLSVLFDFAEVGVGVGAAGVGAAGAGGAHQRVVGRPKRKAPAGFPSITEPVRP